MSYKAVYVIHGGLLYALTPMEYERCIHRLARAKSPLFALQGVAPVADNLLVLDGMSDEQLCTVGKALERLRYEVKS